MQWKEWDPTPMGSNGEVSLPPRAQNILITKFINKMNTHNPKITKWVKRISGLMTAVTLLLSMSGIANARILFEDDEFFNVNSEGIILDQNNNLDLGTLSSNTYAMTDAACLNGETYTATINGTAVVYTATTVDCAGDNTADTVAVLQGLAAAIDADFTVGYLVDASYAANTITITATVADPANNYTTIAADTSTGHTLTATGANLTGGVTGDTVELQFGNDTTDALISYDPNNQDLTLSTPGGDFDFSDDNLKTTGGILMQGASEFHIREDSDPATNATCTILDEVIIDTTDNELQICTATGAPGTWTAIGAGTLDGLDSTQFLRSDASDNYTSGTLTFDAGTILLSNGAVDFSGATSFLLYQGSSFPASCIEGEIFYNTSSNTTNICTATGTPGTWTALSSAGIPNFEAVYDADGDNTLTASGTFDIDAVGALGIDSDAAVTIGGAGITLTSDGSTDVSINAADDLIFDDFQLTGIVQLTDSDSDWDATFAGNGIVDNINSLASTSAGEGASNVGIQDASTWFTGTEIETALNEIEALFGSTTSSTFNFDEDNVLADDDPVYTALNKLDLKWGDLASTANNEGASLVGIEDTGGYFTLTTVEGALAELGADIGKNFEDLTFYPEYPDSIIHADGGTNKGTLEAFYDTTEVGGYYNWTSKNGTTQDIDIRFSFPLPTDFSATGDFTYRYRTGSTTENDNDVEIRLYNVTDSQECANDLQNLNATANFVTEAITAGSINTGCTGGTALDAGDIVEVQIHLTDNSGTEDFADIGTLVWNYTK